MILGNFYPNLKRNEFFWKKGKIIFQISTSVQKIWKKKQPVPDKNSKLLIDRETEDNNFIGTTVGQGVQKIISGTEECDSLWEAKNNRKLNLSGKLWYLGQIYTLLKKTEKKHIKFSLELKKLDLLGTL